jgi:hypothetical protein
LSDDGIRELIAMSNANLPDRWLLDRRFRRDVLSDSAFRSYIAALMWSVSNRTDGQIVSSDLPYMPSFNAEDIPELVGDDLLEPCIDGWLITDYPATQSSRTLLESYEHRKRWDRDRKAREAAQRRAAQRDSSGNSRGNFPPDSSKQDKTRQNQTNPKAPKVPRSNATTRKTGHLRSIER